MRALATGLATLLAAAAIPVAASAQEPDATDVPPAPAAEPGPAVPAAPTVVASRLEHAPLTRGTRQALVGGRIGVNLQFAPGSVGQKVVLRWRRDGRTVGTRTLTVQPIHDDLGRVQAALKVPAKGVLALTVGPAQGDPALATRIGTLHSHAASALGAGGVKVLVRRLASLRFLGAADASAFARYRGITAFQKANALAVTGRLDAHTIARILRAPRAFPVRYPGHGRHIEADLSHQVLAEILPGGRVRRIYPISSGKPSTPTITGSFRVYLRAAGTNAKGMFDSSYFHRGYAIHGYFTVPAYPASHGCLRVFLADAPAIFGWVRVGTPVDVYW